MDIAEQMQEVALFAGISDGARKALSEQARRRTHRPGEMILGETDSVRAFYVVLSGQVKLYKSSPEGKEQTVSLLGKGEPFGLCTAFAVEPFPVNVMALEDSAILTIPGPVIETVAGKEPSLLLNVISILSRRFKESMTLIESLSLKEIPERLATFLVHALKNKRGDRLELTITQRELAKILGSTPEALSRAIRKMNDRGILAVEGRTITVLDRKTLEMLAEGD
ncbi:MAG: Crp/Fnr family transcriptional regulator [Syntrophales bacterium]|jgi:CRP/FNR family transcriptional regulator|nr:Crp/Fnr family transcriptional regulator [Syntrophales bacterium]